MKKYRNKIKITSIIFLLLVGLLSPVQGAQPILQDSTTKDYNYKPLVNLFEIRGLGLEVIKYIGCKDKDGMTALHWSVGLGYLDCAKYVVGQGPSIKSQSKYSSALLCYAGDGYLRVVKYLLNQGADIHATDKDGWTALQVSAFNGHLDCLKYLVQQGADIHSTNEYRGTALHLSAEKGHLDIVKYLVEQGTNVNAQNENEETALFLSAYEGHLDCVKFLLQQGAGIHAQNENGDTALLYSACSGHLDCLKFLIQQGAEIHDKNENGNTAVLLSAYSGHLDCVKFLIQQGADIHDKNKYKETALHLSGFCGKKQNIVNHLIEEQWFWAAKNGKKELLERLYAEHEDLIEKHKNTALTWSTQNSHLDCVKYLLQQGAKNKKTPLFLSAYKGHLNWLEAPADQIYNLCTIL